MSDLLALTATLVDIPSVSLDEKRIADHLEAELAAVPWLRVDRHGDNIVARTDLGRPQRLLLVGHTDTVPANGNASARLEGDTLWGLGASDMKAGLAVFLDLARTVEAPAVDVSYVFYAGEEVASEHNGLGHLFRDRPELLAGDAAVIGEGTCGEVEAGCQGTIRLRFSLVGERAHTARAWLGVNAVHRAGRLLAILDAYEGRRPVIDGCEFREGLLAVAVDGGVAGNVVPDRASVTVNLRYAPDRTVDEAQAHVHEVLGPVLGPDDEVEVLNVSEAAAPRMDHPLLRTLAERNALPVRAKLGWTDVARFAAHGIPACNFGPGDPTLAHTREERVERAPIEAAHAALLDLIERGPAAPSQPSR